MELKKCTTCKELKTKENFSKHKKTKDSLNINCRKCCKISKDKWKKRKTSLPLIMFSDQKGNSKTRNHPMPSYSKEDFVKWVLCNPKYDYLYDNWVKSGYDKLKKPSVDRINDFKPYSFSNIQLMTWGENLKKAKDDIRNGTGSCGKAKCKSVKQYTLDGKYLKTFHSVEEAQRQIGCNHISCVCLGKRKHSGGFKWSFN